MLLVSLTAGVSDGCPGAVDPIYPGHYNFQVHQSLIKARAYFGREQGWVSWVAPGGEVCILNSPHSVVLLPSWLASSGRMIPVLGRRGTRGQPGAARAETTGQFRDEGLGDFVVTGKMR